MKKALALCLALAFMATSVARAFEPTVSLKYDGVDLRLKGVSANSEAGGKSWRFTTPDSKHAVTVDVDEFPEFPGF